MSIKRSLTAVAVDSARDYARERLQQLKKLDLDHDGQKDVDQVVILVNNLAEKVKEAVESTDFQKLATGLEQVIAGATLIGSAVDRDKLRAASKDLVSGLQQLGKFLQLGIQEVKRQEEKS
jgi:hypothetical protein